MLSPRKNIMAETLTEEQTTSADQKIPSHSKRHPASPKRVAKLSGQNPERDFAQSLQAADRVEELLREAGYYDQKPDESDSPEETDKHN
jgi:hypothetical protein